MIKSSSEEIIIKGVAEEVIADFMLIVDSIVNDLHICSKEDMINFVNAACELGEMKGM